MGDLEDGRWNSVLFLVVDVVSCVSHKGFSLIENELSVINDTYHVKFITGSCHLYVDSFK